MDIIVTPGGDARCVYSEDIDLAAVGTINIRRASFVEPDAQGRWRADLSPVAGPVLGPFPARSQALTAETEWLAQHWLNRT
jgi:hypothetical protein